MLSSGTGLKGNVRATKVSWISTGFSKPSPVLKDHALKKKQLVQKSTLKTPILTCLKFNIGMNE